jgi:hypothetical protein
MGSRSPRSHLVSYERQMACHVAHADVGKRERRLARPEGFEPPTYGFEARRSIQLSYGRTQAIANRTEPQLVDETNLHHNGRIGAAQALSWRPQDPNPVD